VLAGGDEAAGQIEMRVRGRNDAESLGASQGLFQCAKTRNAQFAGDFCPLGSGDIINSGEDDLAGGGEVGINAGVFLPQGTDSDDCDFEFGGHDVELRLTIYTARQSHNSIFTTKDTKITKKNRTICHNQDFALFVLFVVKKFCQK
jgi:hypothetical protein